MESGLCPARGKRRRVTRANDDALLSNPVSEDIEMESQVKDIVKEINAVEEK